MSAPLGHGDPNTEHECARLTFPLVGSLVLNAEAPPAGQVQYYCAEIMDVKRDAGPLWPDTVRRGECRARSTASRLDFSRPMPHYDMNNLRKGIFMRLSMFTALILSCAPATLHAAQAAPFHWSGKVASGKTLTVKGVSGSIHAQPWSGAEVDVNATRTARRSNPDEVKIVTMPTSDGYMICALYPGEGNDCVSGHSRTHDNDTEVQFTVKVPNGVRLKAQMVNGEVVAQDLHDDVDASTVNGKIEISTLGSAMASSVNGSIHASMGRVNWSEPRKFHTVNGAIDLDLPASASADVRVNTVNGAISSDFPLTVRGNFGGRSISGTIGNGGRVLEISTVNGSVHLRRHNSGTI